MWICPNCQQQFLNKNQYHSCNERTVEDFLKGKSVHTVELYNYFIEEYQKIGEFVLHPAKSRIAFAGKTRFGYIHRLGKDFLDVSLTFDKPYRDNLCFYRIGEVPGGKIFQHYLRIYSKDDINKEVRKYMKLALHHSSRLQPE
jgi:hypothetical protein